MAKTKTTAPKRKTVWQLSRRGVYGAMALVLAACAWTFFLGVLVGRGTAPVKFDMEKLGQNLQALREQVQQQQAQQLQAYSNAVENKSDLDFYEDLKQSGEDPAIAPNMTRALPKPTVLAETSPDSDDRASPVSPAVPVKTRMAGLQPKKKSAARPQPTPVAVPPPAAAAPSGALTLQVASLRDAQTAEEMAARLRREGYRAERTSAIIPGKGRWHRVHVGRFTSRDQAAQTIRALEAKGMKPILVAP